jgi:hypothetical protein
MINALLKLIHQTGIIDSLIDLAYFLLDVVIKFLAGLIERFF